MLTRLLCTAALAAMLAGPAQALSCLRPTVTTGFVAADTRPEGFIMALGKLTRTGPDTSHPTEMQTGAPHLPAPYTFPAEFTGQAATAEGFVVPLDTPVQVTVNCASAWCGGVPLDSEALVYLRMEDGGSYMFEADLCEPFYFSTPTEDELEQVIGCLRGDACEG